MTNIVRKPYVKVIHTNSASTSASLSDVISARVQAGFDQRVAEATVQLRSLPANIQPWDTIDIIMGGTQTTASTRFSGFYLSYDRNLYPQEVTLNCRGKLAK